jgi:hypothetical protein
MIFAAVLTGCAPRCKGREGWGRVVGCKCGFAYRTVVHAPAPLHCNTAKADCVLRCPTLFSRNPRGARVETVANTIARMSGTFPTRCGVPDGGACKIAKHHRQSKRPRTCSSRVPLVVHSGETRLVEGRFFGPVLGVRFWGCGSEGAVLRVRFWGCGSEAAQYVPGGPIAPNNDVAGMNLHLTLAAQREGFVDGGVLAGKATDDFSACRVTVDIAGPHHLFLARLDL